MQHPSPATGASIRDDRLPLQAWIWAPVTEPPASSEHPSTGNDNPWAKPGAPVRPGVPSDVHHLSTWSLDLYPVLYKVLGYTPAASLHRFRVLNRRFYDIGESLLPANLLSHCMSTAQFTLHGPAKIDLENPGNAVPDPLDPEMEWNGCSIATRYPNLVDDDRRDVKIYKFRFDR
jgi:hypothetical protein